MKAEILCVGTELLLGDVVNTNAAFISRELASLGVDLYYHNVVGDNPDRLSELLKQCFERSDVVIMTGGLGPTYDDLTKETVARYFGLKMVTHEPSLESMRSFFKKLSREMTPNNEKQAQMPEGAVVFENEFGTAPGLAISKNGKTAVLLPGPPREMMPMFTNKVAPYLHKMTGRVFVSTKVNLFDIGESKAEDILVDMMKDAANPTLAPYIGDAEMHIRITASARTREEARALIEPAKEEVIRRLKPYVYACDAANLQSELVRVLTAKKLRVGVAESLTGGLVSKRITETPGSSQVFDLGVCAYSNEMKERVLGVSRDTLAKFGAVSEQTAREMAQGVLKLSGADIGVATTGIAGPGGGSEQKPVGLVYVACATESGVKCVKLELKARGRDREMIRSQSAARAIYMALIAAQAGA